MPRAALIRDEAIHRVLVFCPACNYGHAFTVDAPAGHIGRRWTWNGSLDKPSFSPAMEIDQLNRSNGAVLVPRCHSFVFDGNIQFMPDCTHPLAGVTVELPEIDTASVY